MLQTTLVRLLLYQNDSQAFRIIDFVLLKLLEKTKL